MKRLATLVFAMLLAGTLSFAQGDKEASKGKGTPAADTSKKGHKGGKKGHKGGKKSKKGEKGGEGTTPPPK